MIWGANDTPIIKNARCITLEITATWVGSNDVFWPIATLSIVMLNGNSELNKTAISVCLAPTNRTEDRDCHKITPDQSSALAGTVSFA